MFDLSRDDVFLFVSVKFGETLENHIVGLGGARGEYYLFLVSSDQRGDLLASLFDGF
jgi:hypothetical protein